MSRITKIQSLSITLFSLIGFWSNAQTDSLGITTSTEPFNSNKNYEYFDTNDFEFRTFFKASLRVTSVGSSYREATSFSVEQKVTPWLSTEGVLYVPYGIKGAFGLKIRYYPTKREKSKTLNDRINNFTGLYTGLGVIKSFINSYNAFSILGTNGKYDWLDPRILTGYSLYVGRQQRIANWGYVDAAVFLNYHISAFSNTIHLGLSLNTGVGVGKTKKFMGSSISNGYINSVNKVFTRKIVFGIDNPVLFISRFEKFIGIGSFAEVSLFEYFSLVSQFRAIHIRNPGTFDASNFNTTLNFELRRYFNVNSRLRKNKEVKPFTGFYYGLASTGIFTYTNVQAKTDAGIYKYRKNGINSFPTLSPMLGAQYRISNSFFFNVRALYDIIENNGPMQAASEDKGLYLNGSVGFIF